MQHRQPPRPINFKRRLSAHLKNDPQVIKWSKRLAGDAAARPTDLSEEQLAFVMIEVSKRRDNKSWLDPDFLLKALADTTPVVAAPKLERGKLADDLELIWSQPEMRSFWNRWDGIRANHGPAPDFATGRGLAMVMGMSGISSHADDAYAELTGNSELWTLVQRLSGSLPRTPQSYENATKQLPRLECRQEALRTNVAMVKALAQLYPGRGIGERLMIDGMAVPAWCAQRPKGETAKQEETHRRLCPEAGPRAITYTKNGKRNVKAGERGSAGSFMRKGKFWRGYYLVCIADQATGLPLVWTTVDANIDEAQAIVPLLSDLARFWGDDFSPELIAGDSAWDEDFWCRMLEVDYGIHPIFRLHRKDTVANVLDHSRDATVGSMTPHGQLVCAAHRKAMAMIGTELAQRIVLPGGRPLRPGQTTKETAFRVRAECSKGCGRLGMQMQADWSRLTHYPHHGAGGVAVKQRYAMRQAMLTRLNGMEGIWQRLQNGKKIGTKDADRTRIRDKAGHDLLVDLAMLSMTAAALADCRREKGIAVPDISPASAGQERQQTKQTSQKRRHRKNGSSQALPVVNIEQLLENQTSADTQAGLGAWIPDDVLLGL